MHMVLDSHQHFWQYALPKHDWIDDSMSAIRRDFLPDDLQPLLGQHGVDGCIAVQADQTLAETDFLLQLGRASRLYPRRRRLGRPTGR